MDKILIERELTFAPSGGEPRRLVARIGYPERDPHAESFRATMGYATDDPRGVRWRAKVELEGGGGLTGEAGTIDYALGSNEAMAVISALGILHAQLATMAEAGAVELSLYAGTWSLAPTPGQANAREPNGTEPDDPLIRLVDMQLTGEMCLRKIVRRLDAGVSNVNDLGFDPSSIDHDMEALERAVVEHHRRVNNGTIVGGWPVTDETVEDVRWLRAMLKVWVDGGALSPAAHAMADRLLKMWSGGEWRVSPDE